MKDTHSDERFVYYCLAISACSIRGHDKCLHHTDHFRFNALNTLTMSASARVPSYGRVARRTPCGPGDRNHHLVHDDVAVVPARIRDRGIMVAQATQNDLVDEARPDGAPRDAQGRRHGPGRTDPCARSSTGRWSRGSKCASTPDPGRWRRAPSPTRAGARSGVY